MYEIKNLSHVSYEELADTHNLVFSDYVIPMYITPEQIEAYFKVSGVDYSRSFGGFYKGKLIGFLANAVDIYNGKPAAWDAMTGIAKEHRGKGLFSKLFEHTRQCLAGNDIKSYYLDVITTNENACSVYQKKGAKIVREFAFFTGSVISEQSALLQEGVIKMSPLSASSSVDISTYQPSFGNRISALCRDADHYLIAECGNTSIMISRQGRISQIRYNDQGDQGDLYKILKQLFQEFVHLDISNIPITEHALIHALLDFGLTIKVKQYEMCIDL